MATLVATAVTYFSQGDEDSFFSWLNAIECVSNVRGVGSDLFIEIGTADVADADLRELIALFHRYNINMCQLQQMVTERNAAWFRDDREKYWHHMVFDSSLAR